MEDFETERLVRWRSATDLPLLVIAIGSLPLLLLELGRDDLPLADRRFLDTVNVVVLVAFGVDDVVELCLARRRLAFVRYEWTSVLI